MTTRRRRKNGNAAEAENEAEKDNAVEDAIDAEEENMRKVLTDAGIEPEGMSKEEQKQIYEMLQASKAQYAHEEEMRKMLDDSELGGDADSNDDIMPSSSGAGNSGKFTGEKSRNVTRSASPEFDSVSPHRGSKSRKAAADRSEDEPGNNDSIGAALQLSVDSQDEENIDVTTYDDKMMDETDIANQEKRTVKTAAERSPQRPTSVTLIDDDSMDVTEIEDPRKSKKFTQSFAGKTINTQESMDLTCLSNDNSGKRGHRAHNITDFESKSMNETNIAATRSTASKVWDRTDIEAVPMEETMAENTEDSEEEIKVVDSPKDGPGPKKRRRKCMLLHSDSDSDKDEAEQKSEEKVNVSLQCSLPSSEDSAGGDAKGPEKDSDDSDESVVFSGHVKGDGDVVEESLLHTPPAKRIALSSNDDGVIPETQDQDQRHSSSSVSSVGHLSVGETQNPYEGETLDPTGVDESDMETQDVGGSPDVFSRFTGGISKPQESEEMIMTEQGRDDEDELAAAEAALEEEEGDDKEDEIDDHVPLIQAKSNETDLLGPLDFGCDYKVKTLSEKEVRSLMDRLSAPKVQEFDAFDPPEDSDGEAEESNSKKGPSSPPIPSLVNKRRLKRRLYDPCPMYAPPGVSVTNFALKISKYWEDYAKDLRAAQEKCHVCLPWGEPIQAGEHAKDSIDIFTGDTLDDDIEINSVSTREARYADRDKKRAAFLAQFNTSGKPRKEQQSSKSVEETLPDISNSPPNITSSPKQTLPQDSDSGSEFEATIPQKKRRKAPGRGRGRGRGEGKAKKLKRPQSNIINFLQSNDTDEEESEITRALQSTREELFSSQLAKRLAKKKQRSESPIVTNAGNEKPGKDEDDDDDIPANLSGQATFVDDGISISSASNRTTPAERMLNVEHPPEQNGTEGDNDGAENDRNSLDDLELEIPDDPLENVEKEVPDDLKKKKDQPSEDIRVVSSDEENQDRKEDSPIFKSSPDREQVLEKSIIKLTDGKLDFPRLSTRKRKNKIPPFDKEGRVNRAVKIGNRLIQSPAPKRGPTKSETTFDFDNDDDIHLQWNRGKNLQTYSRKDRVRNRLEKEMDEEAIEPVQEPVDVVACPLCLKEFPQSEVEAHAATCFGDDQPEDQPEAEEPVAGPSRRRNQTPLKRKREAEESEDEDLELLECALRRPPIRRKAKVPKETEQKTEQPKKGRGRKKNEEKGRKSPVVLEEEDSDTEEVQPKSPKTKTPSKEDEPTRSCIICSMDIPVSQFEVHVMVCLDRAEKNQEQIEEEKRTTRQRKRK